MNAESHPEIDRSSFLSTIPFPVLQAYQKLGGHPAELNVALSTDLSAEGEFGEQWLLVDRDTLQVLSRRNGSAQVISRQFSNEQTERFALAAHYLRQRIEMGPKLRPPPIFPAIRSAACRAAGACWIPR
jgi:hypothetical protein